MKHKLYYFIFSYKHSKENDFSRKRGASFSSSRRQFPGREEKRDSEKAHFHFWRDSDMSEKQP